MSLLLPFSIITGGVGGAEAQTAKPPRDAPVDGAAPGYDTSVTVGVLGGYAPDYDGSRNYQAFPAPVAVGVVHGYAFALTGNQFGVDLVRNPSGPVWELQAGPTVRVNFNRSSVGSIRDTRVRALGALGKAVEVGGFVGVGKTGVLTSGYDNVSISLGYIHDVSGVHDGGVLQPSFNYLTPLSTRLVVGIAASAEIVSDAYARTYYGITPVQSTASTLPSFEAGGGLKSWNVGLIAGYSLTGDLLHGVKVGGGLLYTRMEGDAARSPLVHDVGSRDQWLGALGLGYTF